MLPLFLTKQHSCLWIHSFQFSFCKRTIIILSIQYSLPFDISAKNTIDCAMPHHLGAMAILQKATHFSYCLHLRWRMLENFAAFPLLHIFQWQSCMSYSFHFSSSLPTHAYGCMRAKVGIFPLGNLCVLATVCLQGRKKRWRNNVTGSEIKFCKWNLTSHKVVLQLGFSSHIRWKQKIWYVFPGTALLNSFIWDGTFGAHRGKKNKSFEIKKKQHLKGKGNAGGGGVEEK